MPDPESAVIPGGSAEEPTKRCPYCAEVIKAAAIRCRYCQSDLPETSPVDLAKAEPSSPEQLSPEPLSSEPLLSEPSVAPLLPEDDEEPVTPAAPARGSFAERLRRPWVRIAMALALVLTLVFLVLAFLDWRATRDMQAADDAARTVRATVSDKVDALLSYQFSTFDSDLKAAQAGMTDAFRKEYDPTVQEIRSRALAQKRSQQADVVAVAVLDATPDKVRTLVFVNTVSQRANHAKKSIMQNRVTVTMVKQGDSWLIDDLSVPQS